MYKIPPTMLNQFNNYLLGRWVDEIQMLRSLNRVKFESNEFMNRGNALEVCVKEKIYFNEGHSFGVDLINTLHERTKGAVWQQYVEGVIDTERGPVMLYGYIDCVLPGLLIDLKCTRVYKGRKFFDSYQHPVYLYCATEQGIEVDQFEYLITDDKEIYSETYSFNDKGLRLICESLIDFAERRKKHILNPKFFGEEIES